MGFLLVFDLTSEQSFLDISQLAEPASDQRVLRQADIVLVGNRKDLADLRAVHLRQGTAAGGRAQHALPETSACTGENVKPAIDKLPGPGDALRIDLSLDKSRLPIQTQQADQRWSPGGGGGRRGGGAMPGHLLGCSNALLPATAQLAAASIFLNLIPML
uniref:CobW domain-containing protein n=1 Tax=Macrostomum lignano TaxID=282301 RepID=A0A1I8FI33_9PLAT